MSIEPRLSVRYLVKRFGGLTAVDGVGFDLAGGEILGLFGPNGSGKSTVMKMIMGVERPTSGSILLDGRPIAGWPAHKVSKAGISIVFQHSRPLPRQTVLEHIKLALLPDAITHVVMRGDLEERALTIAARVGLAEVVDRHPATLPFADLRRMELAKAVARDPAVVLVDEPFAGLASHEVAAFADLIRGFRDEGRAILLVDHNVKSVTELADRAYVMHHGCPVAEGTPAEVIRDPVVRRIYIGDEIKTAEHRSEPVKGTSRPLLHLQNVDVAYGKAVALENVSIDIAEGQFTSIVGLNGAGKTTLFNAVCGLVPYQGEIRFDGADLRGNSVAGIARRGIVQCPETRELFTYMTVRENLDLGGAHLARDEHQQRLDWLLSLFPVLRQRQKQAAGTLSGGEQQMLAIARALMMRPRILILDEPTLGLAPVIVEQLSKALETLRDDPSITVVLGEQNVTFALSHAHVVHVLDHARIVWSGPPHDFAAQMGDAYL